MKLKLACNLPLRKYSELGNGSNDPCKEYPGLYFIYLDDDNEHKFFSYKEACDYIVSNWKDQSRSQISICWQASFNDPRCRFSWFRSFVDLELIHKCKMYEV